MGRSGHHRHIRLRNLLLDDFRERHERMLLDALRHIQYFLSGRDQRAQTVRRPSGKGACNRHDKKILPFHRLPVIGSENGILRESDARKHLVLMLFLQHFDLRLQRRPDRDLMSILM